MYGLKNKMQAIRIFYLVGSAQCKHETYAITYSQVHKYWDIDTILTVLALYTTTMDFKWNEQDVL